VNGIQPRFVDRTKRLATPSLAPTLREMLRTTTTEIHQRLHGHDGLAAVTAGTIDRSAYKALLCRLYGFHRAFEASARIAPERTRWLESDLTVLGVDGAMQKALPLCTGFSAVTSPEYVLGARYVVEGSALGGRGLARQLDGLLGTGIAAGRRFFSGHGNDTGDVWRTYLARLSDADTMSHCAIVAGAVATFAIFEHWLEGWTNHHD